MESLLRVAIAGGGGLVAGSLAGLAAAVLALLAKRWRNGRLHSRGLPGIKDAILPQAFIVLCAIGGLLLGAGLSLVLDAGPAVLVAGLGPAVLLAVLSVAGSIWQASAD